MTTRFAPNASTRTLDLIVAGYSNDVMSYIPSKRILEEGGYEAVDSMIYYAQPGPYTDSVEDQVFDAIYDAMGQVGCSTSIARAKHHR